MQREQYNQEKSILPDGVSEDVLNEMLQSVYPKEAVPEDVKIRLQNRIACQSAMETEQISFWWLPATIASTISLVAAAFLCLAYVIINLTGTQLWMPNFLQFVSEIWLKIHLLAILIEVAVSWVITFIGVWKGNLVKGARIF